MAGIVFLLNEQQVELHDIDCNTTLLQYLRQHQQLTGTKEGCASGDCGACTVTLVEVIDDQLSYHAINACITFVASLHGKQIITVEHLAQGQALHPVQQAMVDYHGSQCGFCTPGFVMSAFTMHQQQAQKLSDRHAVVEALAGNLCRCTGYRSIIDATMSCANNGVNFCQTDQAGQASDYCAELFNQQQQNTKTVLQRYSRASVTCSVGEKSFYAPTTIAELATLVQQKPAAKLLAGGTDLALTVTQQQQSLTDIIYLGRVAELTQIKQTPQHLVLGAGVTYQQLAPQLQTYYPELVEMLSRLGSPQIRNVATIGGNIANASPIGDMPPALIALNSELILRQGEQVRRIALEQYFVDYKKTILQAGEFIEQILIPKPAPLTPNATKQHQFFKVYKISKRLDDDISAVLMAVNILLTDNLITDVSIAFGGMAAIPKRATKCEQALVDQPWQLSSIAAAKLALATDFSPLSDVRASAEYRLLVAQNLLQKMFIECQQAIEQTSAPQTRKQIVPTKVTHYA